MYVHLGNTPFDGLLVCTILNSHNMDYPFCLSANIYSAIESLFNRPYNYIANCSLPAEPCNGAIVDYERLNETVLEGTVLPYQCDNGLSLTGPNTITCTNTRVWSTEPETIKCVPRTEG